jgi:hypothetical protein
VLDLLLLITFIGGISNIAMGVYWIVTGQPADLATGTDNPWQVLVIGIVLHTASFRLWRWKMRRGDREGTLGS